MTSLPKISIITSSFNQGQYIEQTILSVLNQSYPNLEYIIIDGGSTDNTVEIIKKYEHLLAYWVSEPDRGQTDAINKGFDIATGDIINWLNSDDYLAPGTLHKIAASFNEPEIFGVTTTVHNFEENGEEWDERTAVYGSETEYIARAFNNQPGTFFRKSIWERYFPLPDQLRYTMDQYLWFCFWAEHKTRNFKTENYTTANFRRHSLSKTSISLNDILFNHLGKVFFNEHNLILWSYFNLFDTEKADIISSYFWDQYDYQSNKISFPALLKMRTEMLEILFQQYLFELLKEDYRHGFFARFNKNACFIKESYFSKADWDSFEKMKYKALKPALMSAYRSVYWKIKAILDK